MNIYLTGYMASGKSYIGRRLAEKLEVPFFDLDELIESRYDQSVTTIFAKEGEAAFRKKESEALCSIPPSANAVVSCGGGAFCFPNNRAWIKNQGISIYLKVELHTLYTRLSENPAARPIIEANNQSESALRQFVEKHLASREPDYELADIIYQADGAVEETVKELAKYFKRFLKG